MLMTRGHSNVCDMEKVVIDSYTGKVKVPLHGGTGIYTTKDLPPLYLSKEEWEQIGRKAGWLK